MVASVAPVVVTVGECSRCPSCSWWVPQLLDSLSFIGNRLGGRASRFLASLGGLAAVATFVVAVGHYYPRYGADRVSHMLDWGRTCSQPGWLRQYKSPWGGSSRVRVIQIECGHDGPMIRYAKFPRAAAVDPDVAGALDLPYCVAGREVVVHLLEDPVPREAFAGLCRKMHGQLRHGHHPPPGLKRLLEDQRKLVRPAPAVGRHR